MADKVNSLEGQETWELTEPPKKRKVLGGRWVYAIKYNSNNEPIRYKARWVVQGFH